MLRPLFSIADIYNSVLLLEGFENPRMPSPFYALSLYIYCPRDPSQADHNRCDTWMAAPAAL